MNKDLSTQGVVCPACGYQLTRSDQRRLNTALGAIRPIPCCGCNRLLQWHHALHTRMIVGGFLFRVGVVALVAVAVAPMVFPTLSFPRMQAVLVALTVVVAGISLTATSASRPFVEVVGNDT